MPLKDSAQAASNSDLAVLEQAEESQVIMADRNINIPAPAPFDSKKDDWDQWIKRFHVYETATQRDTMPEKVRIMTLIYIMGGNASDVYESFKLSSEQNTYNSVVKKFKEHFKGKVVLVFERTQFVRRMQGEKEPVMSFIEDLQRRSDLCKFGELRDDMLHTQIIAGLRDSRVRRRLMADDSKTLDQVIADVKAAELTRQQDEILQNKTENASVDEIKSKRKSFKKPHTKKFDRSNDKQKRFVDYNNKPCHRCGAKESHPLKKCKAKDAICHLCSLKGHFQSQCRTKRVQNVDIESGSSDDEIAVMCVTNASSHRDNKAKWRVTVKINEDALDFKIDSGADVTCLPENIYQRLKSGLGPVKKAKKKLLGADQKDLSVIGRIKETLTVNANSVRETIYIVKELKEPLLGRPAIEALNLIARVNEVSTTYNEEKAKTKYPQLFHGLGKFEGEYKIELKPDAKPFALMTPRRVPLPLKEKVREEIERMEKLGVIRKVEEPTEWCAGMVCVPKANKKVRICVDLTRLNENVCRQNYPLPEIDAMLAEIGESRVFSKLDANSGFWQQPLAPESQLLTTFITPFGRYCFQRMCFGLKSAPEVFQRKMQLELQGLEGVKCIMDDILIHAKTQTEHDKRLDLVLTRLMKAHVTLNSEKCEFSKQKLKFAGYQISSKGIEVDKEKTEAIEKMERPQNVSDVRRFLGMVNHLQKFVENLAEKTKPLRDLLSTKNQWYWGPPQEEAFCKLKEDLSETPVLAHYQPERETVVSADSSSFGLGACILQKQDDGTNKPIAYASRALTATEQRYAMVEKEALAVTWALERFSNYILGKDIIIETDHKPLVSLLGSKNLFDMPPRIQRFKMRLMRYSYKIKHVPGKENITADALSRAPVYRDLTKAEKQLNEEISLYVASVIECLPGTERRLNEIRLQQEEDEVCRKLKEYATDGWPDKSRLSTALRPYWQYRGEITLQHNLLMKDSRVIIPSALRLDVLDKIHTGHQGIQKCRERAKQAVWWPGLSKQLEDLVRECPTCIKTRKNHAEPLIPSSIPERPWQKVGTDLFEYKSQEFVLVVDYLSRYCEVGLLKTSTSEEVVQHLKAIFSRHGIPEVVISDNGPQYSSAKFAKFSQDWGFSHITSSPRHPQSNGEAERMVQTVKRLLTKSDEPQAALLAYRSTPLENGYSPAEILMGRKLRTTLPLLPEKLIPKLPDLSHVRASEIENKKRQTLDYNRRHRATDLNNLEPGETVWISDYKENGTVLNETPQPRSYLVETQTGRVLRRNRKHLTPNPKEKLASQLEAKPPAPDQPEKEDTLMKPNSPSASKEMENLQTSPCPVKTTRSGRRVIPPKKLTY